MRAVNRKLSSAAPIIDPAAIVHEMRVLKSLKGELMQRAADIAAEAHVEAMKTVRPGMKGLKSGPDRTGVSLNGAAGQPTRRVWAGPNATVLHYINNGNDLHDGDLLLIDGAEYKATRQTSRERFRSADASAELGGLIALRRKWRVEWPAGALRRIESSLLKY